MKPWTLSDIAACLGSSPESGDLSAPLSGVSTDSRTLERGSLFVPLVGENFDGHDYVRAVIEEKGAIGVVWSRSDIPDWLRSASHVAVFAVDDTLAAYQALGLAWKNKLALRCIGITGSVGKTTCKEILAQLVEGQFAVHKSRANYNNDIGVPKTLLEAEPQHEIAVVEMGMRGRGEIERLAIAAGPEIGLITSIGTSHLELLGSREEIARAKGELLENLPSDGVAVLPFSDDYFSLLESLSTAPVLSYSAKPNSGADFCPERVVSTDAFSTTFVWSGTECRLPLPGEHHLHDAFAALAVGSHLGMSPQLLLDRVKKLHGPEGRAEWRSLRGAKFYMDAYNSAPESLRASLGVLRSCQGRKLAVLADMLELGPQGPEIHAEIGTELSSFGIDQALCFGPLSKHLVSAAKNAGVNAHWFNDKEKLTEYLNSELLEGDFVLVKASRGMALETVVDSIKERVG